MIYQSRLGKQNKGFDRRRKKGRKCLRNLTILKSILEGFPITTIKIKYVWYVMLVMYGYLVPGDLFSEIDLYFTEEVELHEINTRTRYSAYLYFAEAFSVNWFPDGIYPSMKGNIYHMLQIL